MPPAHGELGPPSGMFRVLCRRKTLHVTIAFTRPPAACGKRILSTAIHDETCLPGNFGTPWGEGHGTWPGRGGGRPEWSGTWIRGRSGAVHRQCLPLPGGGRAAQPAARGRRAGGAGQIGRPAARRQPGAPGDAGGHGRLRGRPGRSCKPDRVRARPGRRGAGNRDGPGAPAARGRAGAGVMAGGVHAEGVAAPG